MAVPGRDHLFREVDREFHLRYPAAPEHLDPNDPGHAPFIAAWWEMYNEFLNRMVDAHFFRFFPHAPEKLDPNDPSHAQLIEYWLDLRDTIEDKPHRYDWSNEPKVGDENAPATPGDDLAPTGGSPVPSGTAPSTGVHMDESEFKEWVHHALEGAHVIGDSAEVLGLLAQAAGAGQHSALVIMGETLGPIGMIASTVIVIGATIHAFGTGKRLQEQEGFCYGVMWEVYGLPNAEKTFIDWFDDSAEQLRESFYEGVASGREKGAETEIRNRVILATAYYQAAGDDLANAQAKVLNDIWQKVRETDKGRDWLGWPEPYGMGT
jgi:hypothetical protein